MKAKGAILYLIHELMNSDMVPAGEIWELVD
jgi:hypothetical protein